MMGIPSSSAVMMILLFIGIVAWPLRVRLSFALRALFHRRTRFRLVEIKSLPAGIGLRQYRSDDRDACLKLYTDKEAGQFPPGFIGVFEDFLDRSDYLKLVFCEKDTPVAVGGIGMHPYLAGHCAWLVFGVVAPAWQGRGLGAALLVSRVALLREPSSSTRLFMTNVAKSKGYFERFGFGSQGMIGSTRSGAKLPCNSALLDSQAWQACRERIQALGLTLPELEVPKVDLHRPPPPAKPDPLSIGLTGFSRLNEAVFLQLAGLISLLMTRHGNNLMGWSLVAGGLGLIVWGGILYRKELKRRKARAAIS
jgi:predicted N-acetyltransferase YhbS